MKNAKPFKKFIAVSAIVLSLASCAMFSGRETPGEYVDDTTITSKIKGDIIRDDDLRALQINVETMQGVVQLSGFVDSAKSKIKAVDVARRVSGVKSVKDDMIIVKK